VWGVILRLPAFRCTLAPLRILVVTATEMEIAPLVATLCGSSRHAVDSLVTGVGMVATAARCSRALARTRYDLALNVGLCGSFDPALVAGTVVHVVADRLAELGAEDGPRFLTLRELGFNGDDEVVNAAPPGNAALSALPAVRGITVNTVHGYEPSIAAVVKRCRPQVESMEGAAFMYACLINGVPFAQVRAVSNVVERRNRESWRVADAIENLANTARSILETL
jgi:futalosine hydrolase